MSNTISLKSISELLDYPFVIPAYQRGYRWTEYEVNDLLDDVWEFTQRGGKPKDEFYCLQPIIVSKIGDKYSVIDGQQRLTTIQIILFALKDITKLLTDKWFSIEYETRQNSETFLRNIDVSRRTENIDYFYICKAYDTITRWFSDKQGPAKVDFLNSILRNDQSGNNVKVIWYEVDQTADPIAIFTRINMGKIPLTNAELVKALFLKSENFDGDLNVRRLRQLETASEWDSIESSLGEEELWLFLTNRRKPYENRIEFIFDLIANTADQDKYTTFRFFNKSLTSVAKLDAGWQDIKRYFLTFSEWFDNREYYHLVGYLIAQGEEIRDLKETASEKTKSEFLRYLKERIMAHVRCRIEELNYEEDKPKIRKVLLLFNVLTLLENSRSNARFQFGRYKNERWDIEHIHAVQSEMPEAINHQIDWLKEVLQLTQVPGLRNRISSYISSPGDLRKEAFVTLYTDVLKEFSENNRIEDIDDISNLALLDSGTNRGYKNAVFPVKRKAIIKKDKSGAFLPLCTKNAFLKYYTDTVDQMTFWGKSDREAYLRAIKATLKDFA